MIPDFNVVAKADEDPREIRLVFTAEECVAVLYALNRYLHGDRIPDGYGRAMLSVAEGLGMIVKDPHYFDGEAPA